MTGAETCHYCGTELGDYDNPKGLPVRTIDHIVPRARGGRDERWNRTWACSDCNVRKMDKWPTCSCNLCRRARRIHKERHRITEFTPYSRWS